MRTRWAVAQIDHAQRVLESPANLADKRSKNFVPMNGLVPETIEALQTNVLETGAVQLENRAKRKKSPDEFGLACT